MTTIAQREKFITFASPAHTLGHAAAGKLAVKKGLLLHEYHGAVMFPHMTMDTHTSVDMPYGCALHEAQLAVRNVEVTGPSSPTPKPGRKLWGLDAVSCMYVEAAAVLYRLSKPGISSRTKCLLRGATNNLLFCYFTVH